MKYWAYLAGKIVLIIASASGMLWALKYHLMAVPYWQPVYTPRVGYHLVEYKRVPNFGYDLWFTAAAGLCFLIACGLLYLAILDQRYRCRVCLRRLRMPIQTGSWSSMLQWGRPQIEYICAYGHGRLNVDQVPLAGSEDTEWTPQREDPWDELVSLIKSDDGKR